jgi:glycosyltransferase involved in cell wall biosynthesis
MYPHEGQPVAIIEALAYDLPVVAVRWRGIPEMLSDTVSFLVDDQEPAAICGALNSALQATPNGVNRERFLQRFRVDRFVGNLKVALEQLA